MGVTNFPNGVSSFGQVLNGNYGFGIGNVYYVCQTTNTVVYADMVLKYGGQTYDNDGSALLHTSIQSALDATVANREDYVLVATDSSDYDLTAALTMTKKGVHLICPGGLSHNGGIPGNAARVEQTTASTEIITSTADCIEIAGFFFKGATDSDIINLSGTRWHNYIHHNFFGGSQTAGAAIYQIGGTGAVYQCTISDNYIMAGYNPIGSDKTISGHIGFTSGSSGRNLIARNIFCTGQRTIVTAGVYLGGQDDQLLNNIFHEAVGGSLGDGTYTKAWECGVTTIIMGNWLAMDTPANSGGTADKTNVENWSCTNGSTIVEAS